MEILTIDDKKYYWDLKNECLIPYELMNTNINTNTNTNNYLNHSLNVYNNVLKNNNINNQDSNDNNIELEWYMENYDIDFWENILSRKLDKEERKMIHGIWNENSLNIDIKMLQKSIINHNCYIKSITTNIGNCLFESLASLGLGDNDLNIEPSKMIRKNLSALLLAIKTEVGFFPNLPNLTPEEIFVNHNDVQFIKDAKTKDIYFYDYDMMIYDLNTNYSWERLPAEFLLLAISRIYEVEILIYHNKSTYINKINVWNNTINNFDIQKIRLGLINEEHYFPLLELGDELKFNQDIMDEILNTEIKYDKYIKLFKKWSKIMMESIDSNSNNNIKNDDNSLNNHFENLNNNFNDSNYNETYKNNENNENKDCITMKTKIILTDEQKKDFEQISNFDDFDFI